MAIPESFKDIPDSLMDIHLSSQPAPCSMDIPGNNILSNIPRLTRTLMEGKLLLLLLFLFFWTKKS